MMKFYFVCQVIVLIVIVVEAQLSREYSTDLRSPKEGVFNCLFIDILMSLKLMDPLCEPTLLQSKLNFCSKRIKIRELPLLKKSYLTLS